MNRKNFLKTGLGVAILGFFAPKLLAKNKNVIQLWDSDLSDEQKQIYFCIFDKRRDAIVGYRRISKKYYDLNRYPLLSTGINRLIKDNGGLKENQEFQIWDFDTFASKKVSLQAIFATERTSNYPKIEFIHDAHIPIPERMREMEALISL